MPLTFHADIKNKLVIASAKGTLTIEDIFEYQRDAWTNPQVRGFNELVDLSGAVAITLPSADRLREFSDFATTMDAAVGSSKLAIVAQGDTEFGLGRMYQAYRELSPRSRKKVGVFRSLREALDYLGVAQLNSSVEQS